MKLSLSVVYICFCISITAFLTLFKYVSLAGYYQQVRNALEGIGVGDSAEGFEDIPDGEVDRGERHSIREALTTKGGTKGTKEYRPPKVRPKI